MPRKKEPSPPSGEKSETRKVIRKCSDRYGFGCLNEHTDDDGLIMGDMFRLVKTHSGDYHLRVCRECENRKSREYAKKKRTRSSRFRDAGEFGVSFSFGERAD